MPIHARQLPRKILGELFSVAAYISNRSQRAALHNVTMYLNMHDTEADMTGLRVLGASAFVHLKTHTLQMGNKARKWNLCLFSTNSTCYRKHNAVTRTVVESRNVTFIETPQDVRRVQEQDDERHRDKVAGHSYINKVIA